MRVPFYLVLLSLGVTLTLAACGGSHTSAVPALQVDCRGTSCGASGNSYTGSGVGIWTYRNPHHTSQPLDITLDSLRNNTVTLVFSNVSATEATLAGDLARRGPLPPLPPPFKPIDDLLPATPYPLIETGEARLWNVPQMAGSNAGQSYAYASILRAQAEVDGFRYRIWVADDQWTPHMQAQIPRMAALLFGVPGYPGMLRQYLADYHVAPWGDYPLTAANAGQLPRTTRDVDFVIAPNGAGNLQFFDASQTSDGPGSNRALAMFLGSEGLSCMNTPAALCVDMGKPFLAFAMMNNLLHEFTHLIDHYQRAVRLGGERVFDRWLKEANASSHGFTVALSRFPGTNPLLFEFGSWFGGKYACPLTSADGEPGTSLLGPCVQNYYSSGQAFLLYLVGQYGTHFYRKLLDADDTGVNAIDAAIRASGGTGFAEAFRRWGGMLALLPKDAPHGYGYPGARVGNFVLPAFDGASLAALRQLPPPTMGPVTLAAYSHWPLVDVAQTGRYERRVVMPPGVAVTVYVQ